jgi:hypothetical protein
VAILDVPEVHGHRDTREFGSRTDRQMKVTALGLVLLAVRGSEWEAAAVSLVGTGRREEPETEGQ